MASTKQIVTRGIAVGGGAPISIQSMCSIPFSRFEELQSQALALQEAGCDILRVSFPDMESAEPFRRLRDSLSIPLVADIHYDWRLAMEAMKSGADKIRINPGNTDKTHLKIVTDEAKARKIPIRVGVNAGSLEKDLLAEYGKPTAEALAKSAQRNVELLEQLDFDDIADLSAEDFVTRSLVGHFGARAVVAGYNFRFGKGARGNAEMLTRLMEENGGRAIVKDEITRDGRTISTTLIRSYLTEGRVDTARELLVTPYFISGRVESGNRVGKTLGFPTINIPLPEGGINLRRGVYLTAVKIGENLFKGLTNVGTCPTFNERKMHTETYILDYNSEIYGEEVKIFFLEFMRDEEKFESPDALKDEINKNINDAMKRSFVTWQEIGLK